MNGSRVVGQVRIVGAGLLGASIGLGLRSKGVDTIVHDSSPGALSLAIDYGAGRAVKDTDDPALIVVAVPPDLTAAVIAQELAAFPDAIVTDVASVKALPLAELRASGADISRYVGGHPLAGRERGGAISARADLFVGRPWVIATGNGESTAMVGVIEDLVLDLDAIPVHMTAEEHDRSVALVSHVPQVVASLLAKQLAGGTERALSLTGQGLLLDTWDTAEKRLTEAWGTFPNYRAPQHEHKRIDWILATPGVTVLKAAINVTRYEAGWPSDHAPVQAVLRLGA